MGNEHQVPPIPSDVAAWLDRSYPERSPDPDHTERELWMRAGERRLVRRVLHLHQKQEQTVYVRD